MMRTTTLASFESLVAKLIFAISLKVASDLLSRLRGQTVSMLST